MKKLIILCVICLTYHAQAQNESESTGQLEDPTSSFRERFVIYKNNYLEKLKTFDSLPDGSIKRVVSNEQLNKELNSIFSTVVIGNNAVATNGNSFGFVQDEDKTSLALNAIFFNKKNHYLTAGINAVNKDGNYSIYSNKAWNNKVGINLSYVRVTKKSIYFTNKEAKKLIEPRKRYALKKLDSIYLLGIKALDDLKKLSQPSFDERFKAYEEENVTDSSTNRYKLSNQIQELESKVAAAIIKLNKLIEGSQNNYDYDKITKQQSVVNKLQKELKVTQNTINNYNKQKDSISSYLKSIEKAKKVINGKNYAKHIDKELDEFNSKNFTTKHYRLDWFRTSFNLSNAEYNLPDSLSNDLVILNEIKRRTVYDATASYHITSHGVYNTYYFEVAAHMRVGSYLDNPYLSIDSPRISDLPDMSIINNAQVIDEDKNVIGNYNDLDRFATYLDLSTYYSYFPTEKRNFGITGRFQFNKIIKEPSSVSNEDSISFMGGFLLRNVKEDSFSKGVFGVEAGFENMPEGKKIKNFFTARLTVGIPFDIFTKTEKKS
ncbi:hypothetical protein JCM19294_2304 [Nonlabens tegetincola]|uniref:Uncharacterized protein n=1 Tax=Nonlabens tegetincola TaxID=323273 RepID=A0A090Q038_9FLAO|nr:hypothetical protein [Nonlabens tegetincola]GAK95522.1 hypothetical protein JCM19294_2304 [Nonlabens tegetincola]